MGLPVFNRSSFSLSLRNVAGLFTFGAIGDLKLHRLAFCQSLESVTLNCGIVHKHVLAAFWSYESVAPLIIEPRPVPLAMLAMFPFDTGLESEEKKGRRVE